MYVVVLGGVGKEKCGGLSRRPGSPRFGSVRFVSVPVPVPPVPVRVAVLLVLVHTGSGSYQFQFMPVHG